MKNIFITILLLILLSVCACKSDEVANIKESVTYDVIEEEDPFEIHYPDGTLIFHQEYIENDFLPAVKDYDGFYKNENAVFIDNGVVCTVCIWDDDIVTYKGITVGDDFEKVKEIFGLEYYVYSKAHGFYDDNEDVFEFCVTLDIEDDYEGNYTLLSDYLTYNYLIKDDKVIAIEIEDNMYHKYYELQ